MRTFTLNTSRRFFALLFISCFFIIDLGSCKKSEQIQQTESTTNEIKSIPEKDQINPSEIAQWWMKLPTDLPFYVDWSKAKQMVIDGKHIVNAPISDNSFLVFYKEKGDTSIKAYAYAFAPDAKSGKDFTGGVVCFNFQDFELRGASFKNGAKQGETIFSHSYDAKSLLSFQPQQHIQSNGRIKSNSIFGDLVRSIGNLFGALGCVMTGGSWDNGPGGSWSNNTYGSWQQSCSGQAWTWNFNFNNGFGTADENGGMPNFIFEVYDASTNQTFHFDQNHTNPHQPAYINTGGGGGGGDGSGVEGIYDYKLADKIALAAGLTYEERNFLVAHYTILFALDGFWHEASRHANPLQDYSDEKILDIIKKHSNLLMTDPSYLTWYYTFRPKGDDYLGYYAWWDQSMYFVDFLDNPVNATAANTNGYLGKLGLESNPAANVNIETNDETVGGYDQTDFGTYQQNSTWPTVNPVIPANKFISYDGKNCLTLAKKQIAIANYQISGYGAVGQTYNVNISSGVNLQQTKDGVAYIRGALQKGAPVIVGIDYMAGAPAGNPDNKTDHFISIVGMGTDSKGKYFRFYDNATSASLIGTSENNKLYYDETTGVISGTTEVAFESARQAGIPQYRNAAGKVIYTVTHIRRSKLKIVQ